ncbi:MAG: SDR family NAD(P)-dependent oxidoreductase [Candidatus Thiodiazotropha sp. (ex Dulcina madagascariensis)]|nr:SDR family NAD(P)-dependent oxidoreductase [Candidatus Thiodiazotropha sp. (ex Epidulcina cf. delphinae)]MCU7929113.1 SDR family NAD(P)-dependent oxidoreductase [Candidatus Thiodiazotropha sp. (ex Dulcina madagascariensis)]MCU7936755.1 SDR family NAD(P)-dependent oxidoreductase [Candidatus Thiodiazotropha sp. (ex Dulcina madagascariensis)]
MKKAVIIGASAGIGRELALILSQEGYAVCATARRRDILEKLQVRLSSSCMIRQMDISDTESATKILENIISELGGMDLIVISAGTGHLNPDLQWSKEQETIDVNVTGFSAVAGLAYRYFIKQGAGHLVGISSLAAIRGGGEAPAYNASKAFVSSYLQGLRHKIVKLDVPIYITDIRPGFVDTAMAKGEGLFWMQSPQKAARQIYRAIQKRIKVAYITKRWTVVAWILKVLPDAIYHKM